MTCTNPAVCRVLYITVIYLHGQVPKLLHFAVFYIVGELNFSRDNTILRPNPFCTSCYCDIHRIKWKWKHSCVLDDCLMTATQFLEI